ncbi:hypothetical protein ACVWYI_003659 [Bradyrhizobium sp. LB13.1]
MPWVTSPWARRKARGHHRRQGQRHEHRDEDRHRQHDGEFAEQAPDDAAHQQQRNQHRDQRDTDRHDGEADFLGALEGGRHRRFAFLDVAGDVLEHHDGVVDDEADRDGERHQRQIVERIADHPHQGARAQQRQRNRDGGNDGRPETAQENEDDHDHQRNGQQQRELDVLDGGADGRGAVADELDLDRGRYRGHEARQGGLDPVDGLDHVGARLLEYHQEHAALAIGPGRLLGVFSAADRLADVADSQGTAIAIGDDDVVPVLGLGQLVVGVDRVGALRAVDIAFGAVDRGDRDLAAHVLHRQALGDEFRRIDLDADGRFLLAADEHLRDARELADLLGELGIDRVADAGQRQCLGGRRQQQDRRVGRVDLAVGRRRGQILRQLAARGIDGALHVIGGAVDAAVEVELDRDRRGAQIARRGHLGDARDLGELPFERLGHRRGHGLRAAARQIGGDLDGREVHLRQWRDRQQGIGDETDEENAGHQQRGADGITDERCRNPSRIHSCRTLFWAGSVLATAVETRLPGWTLNWPPVITCCPGVSPSSMTERPSMP